jgi:hypothetical protein
MAVKKKTTLTRVIEEALRQYLMPPPKAPPPIRSKWIVVEGKRPPAIDIADRDRLYDKMEGRIP